MSNRKAGEEVARRQRMYELKEKKDRSDNAVLTFKKEAAHKNMLA
jgi:hypothetical protein